jgi:tripartite-type tricarboxylate transporter receptor subunit TctC
MMRRNKIALIATAALISVCVARAQAQAPEQNWPTRTIHFVNPSAAGGGADILIRWLASKVQPLAGVPVVVENKTGANANLATELVVGSRPDGYTVLFNSSSAVIANPFVMKDLNYDPDKDLAPVASVFNMGLAFAVPPQTPANNLQEFVEYLRKKKTPILYGVPVVSVLGASALFQEMSKTKGTQVNYKTMADALKDISGGDIDFGFIDATLGVANARSGRIKLFGVSPPARLPSAPNVPTLAEAGLPGYSYVNFWAAWMPAGSPPQAIAKLQQWLNEVCSTQEAKDFFLSQSVEVAPSSSARLRDMMKEHHELWVGLAKAANITPQ